MHSLLLFCNYVLYLSKAQSSIEHGFASGKGESKQLFSTELCSSNENTDRSLKKREVERETLLLRNFEGGIGSFQFRGPNLSVRIVKRKDKRPTAIETALLSRRGKNKEK